MPTTLKIQSFTESNIRERSLLKVAAIAGATELVLESTEGFAEGQRVYIGPLSREGCEKVIVASVVSANELTLTAPLELDHPQFDAVTAVLGDLIHIYRASDVDGSVPADELFTVLATRNIDPDQSSTYYTDSSGSSAYWYRSTFYNSVTNDETALSESQPVRGDDFGHYASLSTIRKEAGFERAHNLSDIDVDLQRRAAESMINTKLGSYYTVPFSPVPSIVETITVKLAAGFLLQNAYRGQSKRGDDLVKQAMALIDSTQSGQSDLDEDGSGTNATASGVSGYPNDTTEDRLFSIGDRY